MMDGAGRTVEEHPSRSPQTWSTGNSYDHHVQGYYICTNYMIVEMTHGTLEPDRERAKLWGASRLMRSSSSSWWHRCKALLGRTMSELALLHVEEQC